jgi:hypothetical protein
MSTAYLCGGVLAFTKFHSTPLCGKPARLGERESLWDAPGAAFPANPTRFEEWGKGAVSPGERYKRTMDGWETRFQNSGLPVWPSVYGRGWFTEIKSDDGGDMSMEREGERNESSANV